MFTEHTFTTGEVTLSYLHGGDPHGTPIVLLHGISMWRKTWLRIMPYLGKQYRLIAPDLRGHGASTHTPGEYRVRDYARDIARLIADHLHRPAVLFGHSLGALAASEVAADERDLVQALIMEDPPLFHHRVSIHQTRWVNLFQPAYELARMGDSVPVLEDALRGRMPDTATMKTFAGRLAALDPEVLTFALEDRLTEGYNIHSLLPKIDCPVLLIQGDPQFGAALSDEDAALARHLLPQARFHRMMGVGHTPHHTHMPDVLRLVKDFLTTVPAVGG
jgi:pimeloyl-ACP methyl ester carboxylesterase